MTQAVLKWREIEPAPGRIEHRAEIPGGDRNTFYSVQPEGSGWNVRRPFEVMFIGSLNRQVASVEEGKAVAEADLAATQRISRWVNYWITHEPPAS